MSKKILRNTANGESVYNKDAVDAMQVANKEYADSIIGSFGLPDYANMETTINRITTKGGTWTVDRNGFVRAGYVSQFTGSNQYFAFQVHVNDVTIKDTIQFANTTFDSADGYCYPVKKGDVVKLNVNTNSSKAVTYYCYFVPIIVAGAVQGWVDVPLTRASNNSGGTFTLKYNAVLGMYELFIDTVIIAANVGGGAVLATVTNPDGLPPFPRLGFYKADTGGYGVYVMTGGTYSINAMVATGTSARTIYAKSLAAVTE